MDDDKIKVILKETIYKLADLWHLTPMQVVKKIIRHWNTNSVGIIKFLYSCIKEEK